MKIVTKVIAFYQHLDSVTFWSFVLVCLMDVALIGIFITNFSNLPREIPLFYSLSWGDQQLGDLWQFLILAALPFLISLTNMIISWQLHPSQILFKRILAVYSAVITLLFLLTAVKIVLIFI